MVGSIGTPSIDAEGMLVGPGAVANAGLKSYPELKDSGVSWLGKVPAHWEVRRLRNVAELRVSNVDKHTREGETLVRLCNYVDVYKNDRIRSSMPFMAATATADELERFRLRSGDVLITKDSEAWDDIGVPALVQEVDDDVASGYHLALLRSDAGHLNGEFLNRAVQNRRVAYQFHVRANGVTRYGLSHEAIKSVCLPVPPLAEQAAIVRFLDHADRRIRRYIRAKQKLITLLEEQKQALIHQAVTGQIDVRTGQPYPAYKPSRVEWLEDVPEHWEVRRLKSKLRPVDRRSSSGTETLLSLRRDFGVVVYAEHFSRPPQGVTLVGYKLVEAGQLVVNRLQANNGLLFCSRLSGVVSPDYSVFAARSPVDMEYLGNLLRTVTYKTHFRRESTGLGTGSAGFLRLYDDRLLETPVALPPLEEQSTLLVSLSEITASLCRAIGRQHVGIALLREYSTRLIADVVTGKFNVREAAERLPEVDPLADEFDALTTQATETGVMELEDATELPEEFAMENEVII